MKVQTNESTVDRVVRIVVAVVLFAVAATGAVGAPASILAWVVGAILLVTGAVGFCPLYAVLRISTAPARR